MMVEWLFLAVPWGYLRFVIVVFPDHTHLLFTVFLKLEQVYLAYHIQCVNVMNSYLLLTNKNLVF